MKVLVVASSKHGSTIQVGQQMAQRLVAGGLEAEFKRPEDVLSLGGIDAVVVGSAVYMTQWTAPALEFIDRFHDELIQLPVWAFSVGLSGVPKGAVQDPRRVGPAMLRLDPVEHRTFAGRLDPTDLSLRERTVARLGGASEGDFRDWDAVFSWVDSIVTHLQEETV